MYCDSYAMLLMKCLHVLLLPITSAVNVEPLLGVVLSPTDFCVSHNRHATCRWRDWTPISKVQLSVVLTLSCMHSCLFWWHWQLSTCSLHPLIIA